MPIKTIDFVVREYYVCEYGVPFVSVVYTDDAPEASVMYPHVSHLGDAFWMLLPGDADRSRAMAGGADSAFCELYVNDGEG